MAKPIPKKGSPYWHYDFIIKGCRFSGTTGLTAKRAAQAFIDQLRQDILLPSRQRPPITLDEACGLYQDHAGTQTSWTTAQYMIRALLHPRTGLGAHTPLADITQRDLIAYIARRRLRPEGTARSNSSINRELDCIRAIWNRADRARFDVGEMPDWRSLRMKQTRKTHRVLNAGEDEKLLENMRDDVRPAVEFLLASGWRRAEVIGLRWSDIDLGARVAITRIKGGDIVTRPLSQAMLVIIANQPKAGPFIFTYLCDRTASKIRVKGQRYPLTSTVLRQQFEVARNAAGLERHVRIHDLRHTRATRVLRATGNLAAVQKMLEHRNIRTTMQYAHVMDEDVRNAMDAADNPRNIPTAKMKNG